jgi:hypothetical protein
MFALAATGIENGHGQQRRFVNTRDIYTHSGVEGKAFRRGSCLQLSLHIIW